VNPRDVPIRFSRLKKMAESASHYLDSITHDSEPGPAMILGTLVHAMVLEPERPIHVFTETATRGVKFRSFEAAHGGELVATQAEYDKAQAVAESVLSDPHALSVLRTPGAIIEKRLDWTMGGRACHGTPDLWTPGSVLVDLKTAATVSPRKWLGKWGTIRSMGYAAQLAWYTDAIKACGYEPPTERFIVAVETRRPYPVVVYRLDESEIEAGRAAYRAWFEDLRVCEESDHWPGYTQRIVDVFADDEDEMPKLIFGEEEEVAQ